MITPLPDNIQSRTRQHLTHPLPNHLHKPKSITSSLWPLSLRCLTVRYSKCSPSVQQKTQTVQPRYVPGGLWLESTNTNGVEHLFTCTVEGFHWFYLQGTQRGQSFLSSFIFWIVCLCLSTMFLLHWFLFCNTLICLYIFSI